MNILFFIIALTSSPNLDHSSPCLVDANSDMTSIVLVDSKAAIVRMTDGRPSTDLYFLPYMSTTDVAFTKYGHADIYDNTDIEHLSELVFLDFDHCSYSIHDEMMGQIVEISRTYKSNRNSKVVLTASTIGDSTDRLVALINALKEAGVRERDIEINLREAVGQSTDDLVKIHVKLS